MKKPIPPTAFLIITVLTGCHQQVAEPEPLAALPTAAVETAAVVAATHQAVELVVGTVRPRTSAMVSAKVSGRIKTLVTQIGRTVQTDELLAEIDAAEIAARVDQARAGLENATRELDRYQKLLTQKAVTQSEYDAVEARHRIAKASVAEAETMLGYTRVVAPFNGVIAQDLADVGDLAAPGKPLLKIEATGGLRFEADVAEALAGRIHLGATLAIQIEGITNALNATVAEIAPAADPLSRTLQVKLDLPVRQDLRAGQFGRLAIPIQGNANLRVPATALIQRGQLEIVFVAATDKAQLRLVRTGKRFGDQLEILSGLDANETVIISGNANLRDGQPINVTNGQ